MPRALHAALRSTARSTDAVARRQAEGRRGPVERARLTMDKRGLPLGHPAAFLPMSTPRCIETVGTAVAHAMPRRHITTSSQAKRAKPSATRRSACSSRLGREQRTRPPAIRGPGAEGEGGQVSAAGRRGHLQRCIVGAGTCRANGIGIVPFDLAGREMPCPFRGPRDRPPGSKEATRWEPSGRRFWA